MFVIELFDPAPGGYQTQQDDNSIAAITSSRGSTRFTLAHLNQLRRGHDVRKLEHEQKLKSVSKQYAPAPEAGGIPGL